MIFKDFERLDAYFQITAQSDDELETIRFLKNMSKRAAYTLAISNRSFACV